MGYIIITRNPRNKQIIAIVDGENDRDEHVAEYKTEDEAEAAAENTTACKVWGYQVIEVD